MALASIALTTRQTPWAQKSEKTLIGCAKHDKA